MPPEPAAQPGGADYPPPVAEPQADYPPPPASPEGDQAPPPLPEAAAAAPAAQQAPEPADDPPPPPPADGAALWAGMENPAAPSSDTELSADDAKAMADLADVDMGDFADEDDKDDEDEAPAARQADADKEPKDDAKAADEDRPAEPEPPAGPEAGSSTQAPAADQAVPADAEVGSAASSLDAAETSDEPSATEDAADPSSGPVRGRVSVPNLVVPDEDEDVAVKSFDGHTYRTGELEAQQRPGSGVTDTPDIGEWKPGEPDGHAAASEDRAGADEQSASNAESKPPEPAAEQQPGSPWDAFAQPWLDDPAQPQGAEAERPGAEGSSPRPESEPQGSEPSRSSAPEPADEPFGSAPRAEAGQSAALEAESGQPGSSSHEPAQPQRAETAWSAASDSADEPGSAPQFLDERDRVEAGRRDGESAGAQWPSSIEAMSSSSGADSPDDEPVGAAKGVASVPPGQLLSAGELPAKLPAPVAQVYGGDEPGGPGAWPPPSDS